MSAKVTIDHQKANEMAQIIVAAFDDPTIRPRRGSFVSMNNDGTRSCCAVGAVAEANRAEYPCSGFIDPAMEILDIEGYGLDGVIDGWDGRPTAMTSYSNYMTGYEAGVLAARIVFGREDGPSA